MNKSIYFKKYKLYKAKYKNAKYYGGNNCINPRLNYSIKNNKSKKWVKKEWVGNQICNMNQKNQTKLAEMVHQKADSLFISPGKPNYKYDKPNKKKIVGKYNQKWLKSQGYYNNMAHIPCNSMKECAGFYVTSK